MKKMTWRNKRARDNARLSECTGKTGYPLKSEARMANRRLAGKVYKCRFCKLWHIGGRRTQRRQRKGLDNAYSGSYDRGHTTL